MIEPDLGQVIAKKKNIQRLLKPLISTTYTINFKAISFKISEVILHASLSHHVALTPSRNNFY